jgi:hypothetical protein
VEVPICGERFGVKEFPRFTRTYSVSFAKSLSPIELTPFQKLRSRSSGGCPKQIDMGILGGRGGMCNHWTGYPSVITREAILHNSLIQVIPVDSSHTMNSYLFYTNTDSSASCVQALLTHDQSSQITYIDNHSRLQEY